MFKEKLKRFSILSEKLSSNTPLLWLMCLHLGVSIGFMIPLLMNPENIFWIQNGVGSIIFNGICGAIVIVDVKLGCILGLMVLIPEISPE